MKKYIVITLITLYMLFGLYLGFPQIIKNYSMQSESKRIYDKQLQDYLISQPFLTLQNATAFSLEEYLRDSWNFQFKIISTLPEWNKNFFIGHSIRSDQILIKSHFTSVATEPFPILDIYFEVGVKEGFSFLPQSEVNRITLDFLKYSAGFPYKGNTPTEIKLWIENSLMSLKEGETKELIIETTKYSLDKMTSNSPEKINWTRLHIQHYNP